MDKATYIKTVVALLGDDLDNSIELAIYKDEKANAYFAIDPSFTEECGAFFFSPYGGNEMEAQ